MITRTNKMLAFALGASLAVNGLQWMHRRDWRKLAVEYKVDQIRFFGNTCRAIAQLDPRELPEDYLVDVQFRMMAYEEEFGAIPDTED